MARKIANVVLMLICVALGWASYDNTFRDDSDVQALAEATACKVKTCSETHKMTKLDRTMLREQLEFTWQSGVVTVDCGRAQWLVGDRECHVLP